MPYGRTDMTSQTGSVYKAALDASSAALAAIEGKRRNINGDGRVNQLVTAVAISTSWQYILDMWEATANAASGTGNFGQVTDPAFPAGVAIGTSSLTTSSATAISFRTKIEGRSAIDLLAPPFQYPVSAPLHPYACVGCLAYQDSGQSVPVTATLRTADGPDNFTTMTHSLTGATLSLPSGVLTQLWWDGAAAAFELDGLANLGNGLCLEIAASMPTGLSGKTLRIGDVQLEGGQVASQYGRSNFGDELARCERYYAKTFSLVTAPAPNAGTGGALVLTQAVGASMAQKGSTWYFRRRMIKAPTVTFFNPGAANGQARNLDTATDCASTAVDLVGESGVSFSTTTPSSSTAGQRLAIHVVADARL